MRSAVSTHSWPMSSTMSLTVSTALNGQEPSWRNPRSRLCTCPTTVRPRECSRGALLGGFRQAGARADRRAAVRQAVTFFEQALQALAHLPEHGDTRVLALELRLAVAYALNALGEHGRRLALLGEAEALARALDDRTRLVRVLAWMAHARMVTGDSDGAVAAGQQALELAVALGDSALQVQAS